jgi:hypothetical protein
LLAIASFVGECRVFSNINLPFEIFELITVTPTHLGIQLRDTQTRVQVNDFGYFNHINVTFITEEC